MMAENYWKMARRTRSSRRQVLLATGSGALAAALLAACGGSNNKVSKEAVDNSGLLATRTERTKEAKPGGTWQDFANSDVPTLDPGAAVGFRTYNEALLVYSFLTKFKMAPPGESLLDVVEGDAAESWEVSGDGLQVTFKLRPNHRFDQRPPTNGRPLDADDVVYSWDYFARNAAVASIDYAQSRNPNAPIISASALDKKTVVFKLAYPWPDLFEALAYERSLYMLPREAEDKFSLRSDMRGTGPFILEKYQGSLGFEYRRRDDWYVKGQPFLEGISRPIITDYATGLAQFETGRLWHYPVNSSDIVRVKQDHMDMVMLQDPAFTAQNTGFLTLSSRPNSPLRDVRMRRALSLVWDRDTYLEYLNNISAFTKLGLPVTVRWHSHLPNGAAGWLDPKGDELGEGAKYFRYDIASAKALLNAAGYQQPIQMPFSYFPTTQHGPSRPKDNETVRSMLAESGLFKLDTNLINYDQEWLPIYIYGAGDYDGITYGARSAYSLTDFLNKNYMSSSQWSLASDPKAFGLERVVPLISKYNLEIDQQKRIGLQKDLQKELAIQMPALPNAPGTTLGFSLRWPWFANHGVHSSAGSTSRPATVYWYDESKKKA